MKIKKDDQVLIISGKDKGRKGKVLDANPNCGQLTVEGINLRKKHVKPKKSGEKGQIIQFPVPMSVSNVKLVCKNCGKAVRVGYKVIDGKKYRVCKKCAQPV